MWFPMFERMFGRVFIALLLITMLSVVGVTAWVHAEPHVPAVLEWVAGAYSYASERLQWLWSWLLHQLA